MWDMTINLGTILQTVIVLASVGAFIYRLHIDTTHIKQKLQALDTKVEKLSAVTIDLAKQDQRLLHLEGSLERVEKYMFEKLTAA